MYECKWNDENWASLLHTIRQQKCILMLGPEAAQEQFESQCMPCTEVLAKELAAKITDNLSSWNIKLDTSNLAQVSQYFAMIKDRLILEASVSSFYTNRQNATSELHQNLSSLPFPLVITSTPDNMFYNALKKHGKNPIVERYHFSSTNNCEIVAEGTEKEPLIFHFFGTIDEPDSLVLTEDDILDFLVAVLKKPSLPDNIISTLRAKNKSMLFLGFGFKYWYLRVLLHVLKMRSKGNRSFALEQTIPSDINEFKRTTIFYKESDYRILLFEEDILQFSRLLKSKYEASVSKRPEHISKIVPDDSPTVFICHANENKNEAAQLYEKLEAQGFNPWLDRQNLRGGDDWDRHISRTIKKDIDYFLVLQSKSMENKLEGYVNKEIQLAIDRQKYFRPGIRFIIPITIEKCEPLEDLDYLHNIDFSTEKDWLHQLTKTIRRDWERRKRGKG
jgi:hypothetical protein